MNVGGSGLAGNMTRLSVTLLCSVADSTSIGLITQWYFILSPVSNASKAVS